MCHPDNANVDVYGPDGEVLQPQPEALPAQVSAASIHNLHNHRSLLTAYPDPQAAALAASGQAASAPELAAAPDLAAAVAAAGPGSPPLGQESAAAAQAGVAALPSKGEIAAQSQVRVMSLLPSLLLRSVASPR